MKQVNQKNRIKNHREKPSKFDLRHPLFKHLIFGVKNRGKKSLDAKNLVFVIPLRQADPPAESLCSCRFQKNLIKLEPKKLEFSSIRTIFVESKHTLLINQKQEQ